MFKGIVEATGRVTGIEDRSATRRFRIETPELAPSLAPGDSVAVDGACLTVTDLHPTGFDVDVIGTTLAKTVAGAYVEGSRVNLERAMVLGGRIDGHLVQGHVDGTGHLMSIRETGDSWLLDFALPEVVFRGTIVHGSITLNGVSLTVAELLPDSGCRIGLIPFTFQHTNLGDLQPGARVNVEGDLIGKYVERIMSQRDGPAS